MRNAKPLLDEAVKEYEIYMKNVTDCNIHKCQKKWYELESVI